MPSNLCETWAPHLQAKRNKLYASATKHLRGKPTVWLLLWPVLVSLAGFCSVFFVFCIKPERGKKPNKTPCDWFPVLVFSPLFVLPSYKPEEKEDLRRGALCSSALARPGASACFRKRPALGFVFLFLVVFSSVVFPVFPFYVVICFPVFFCW